MQAWSCFHAFLNLIKVEASRDIDICSCTIGAYLDLPDCLARLLGAPHCLSTSSAANESSLQAQADFWWTISCLRDATANPCKLLTDMLITCNLKSSTGCTKYSASKIAACYNICMDLTNVTALATSAAFGWGTDVAMHHLIEGCQFHHGGVLKSKYVR